MVNINGTSVRPKDGVKGYNETPEETSRYVHDVPVPLFNYMSLCVRKPTFWVPTRSDTNRAVQSQKMVRGWKFCIEVEEGLYYRCSENKGADQLRGYCLRSHL